MTAPQKLEPARAYEASMALIRTRLTTLSATEANGNLLARAETFAFQIRKIVEGVAFGALSAVEHRNRSLLKEQRTKDADKLLSWLAKKNLLELPSAQRLDPPIGEFNIVLSGVAERNLTVDQLSAAYGRASALIHERHPERLTVTRLQAELSSLEDDARSLRSWLWLHLMHLRGEAFLIQMGMFGTSSFFSSLGRVSGLPDGVT
jgi:hypothetical protein